MEEKENIKVCKEEGCNNPVKARGYCHKHYNYHKRIGTFETKKCSVIGCKGYVNAKDYCNRHYQQIHTFGRIFDTRMSPNEYILNEEDGFAEILLRNNDGSFKSEKLIIDMDDVEKVKPYKWNIRYKEKYGKTKIDGIHTELHRFLLKSPKGIVDHIDRNPLNNRKSNLRVIDMIKNGQNRSLSCNNTSGIKGVWFSKKDKKWVAQINYKSVRYWLGRFDKKEDAILARLKAEREYFGKYSIYKEFWESGEIDESRIRDITGIS